MELYVYLRNDIADVLNMFGDLDFVVNEILRQGYEGKFDITDKPAIGPKVDGRVYKIEITEPNYLQMLNLYGTRNNKISLRRLLYWFVENEIYSELELEIIEKRVPVTAKYIARLIDEVHQMTILLPEETNAFDEITRILTEIQERQSYV